LSTEERQSRVRVPTTGAEHGVLFGTTSSSLRPELEGYVYRISYQTADETWKSFTPCAWCLGNQKDGEFGGDHVATAGHGCGGDGARPIAFVPCEMYIAGQLESLTWAKCGQIQTPIDLSPDTTSLLHPAPVVPCRTRHILFCFFSLLKSLSNMRAQQKHCAGDMPPTELPPPAHTPFLSL
jgi:hypothetical protein